MVIIGSNDLKLDCGVWLTPCGVDGENFDACLECPVRKSLKVVVDDVTYGTHNPG